MIESARQVGADTVSLTKRILDYITEMWSKLKAMASPDVRQLQALDAAKSIWQDMYNAEVARVKGDGNAQDNNRYAVIGEEEASVKPFNDMLDEFFSDTEKAREKYNGTYFYISNLPKALEGCGFGDGIFEVPFKTVKTHYGKSDHLSSAVEWKKLPSALAAPFAITKYGKDGFRIYSYIKSDNGKNIVIGIDVKKINQGKRKPLIEVNSVRTAFENNGVVSPNEELIGYDKKITPVEKALLKGLNYQAYPTLQELNSADKGSKVSGNKQENEKKLVGSKDKTQF